MNVGLITLGCPKNTVDSEIIKGAFQGNSLTFVDRIDQAEIIIINTCGFIQSAKEEAIEAIFEAVHLKNHKKCSKIIVTGCLVTRYKTELIEEIPEVDLFVENREIPELISQIAQNLRIPYHQSYNRSLLTPAHYAYLKIAEGCNNRCAYCAIPMIRGSFRSRGIPELVREAEILATQGVKELIIIAQDTTLYGTDLANSRNLTELLKKLCEVPSLKWIRLMYTHPAHFTDELMEFIASQPKICKYLDIPLQHVSDPILKRMRRKVTRREIEGLIQKLRDTIPGLVLRTSLMVGFPGETNDSFNELIDFVTEIRFERMGAFAYSQEEGTPAAEFADQIAEEVKQERLELLLSVQADIAAEKNASLINKELDVLVDEFEEDSGYYLCRTQWDAPEVDNTVLISDSSCEIGRFYKVKIIDAYEFDLVGNVLPEHSLAWC